MVCNAVRNAPEGRLDELRELKSILKAAIDANPPARDLSSLARQYRETIKEIDAIENGEDDGDEIASIILRHR